MEAGVLFMVSTPLGNLEDITQRALRTLREVDAIACEDTRRTKLLLRNYGIRTPLLSCHDHNEKARASEICRRLLGGESFALVTDAGTPTISDPGYRVVRATVAAGIRVVPVPGPCAAVTALAASGLPTDAFLFRGFLPRRRGKRLAALQELQGTRATLVLFEAPHRILATLDDIQSTFPGSEVVVAREMTKLHEEFLRGTAAEIGRALAERSAVRGEMVVLVAPGSNLSDAPQESLPDRVRELQEAGRGRMEAIKIAAKELGMHKREAYALLTGKTSED